MSTDGGRLLPSHCIFIVRVWTVFFNSAFHTVILSASLIWGTKSMTSAGVMGSGTLSRVAVVIFFEGSSGENLMDFPKRLLMLRKVSSALWSKALMIFRPVDDFRLLIFSPLYPFARCTSTSVSFSH